MPLPGLEIVGPAIDNLKLNLEESFFEEFVDSYEATLRWLNLTINFQIYSKALKALAKDGVKM